MMIVYDDDDDDDDDDDTLPKTNMYPLQMSWKRNLRHQGTIRGFGVSSFPFLFRALQSRSH